jgi:hypothetical protein
MAANGHSHPPTLSHTGPRNTWSDGTSSHVWHHQATLRNRLTVKQVHGSPSYCRARHQCSLAKILSIASAPTVITGRIWWR